MLLLREIICFSLMLCLLRRDYFRVLLVFNFCLLYHCFFQLVCMLGKVMHRVEPYREEFIAFGLPSHILQ